MNKIKNMNYTFNHNINNKKKILNNTNSNININIKNINDNNTNKKESKCIINGITSKSVSKKNNFNNNITTSFIINNNDTNNNNNNIKMMKNYPLLFYNHKNKIISQNSDKINSRIIRIQSININLGEDLDNNNYGYNNIISNNNCANNNVFKEYNNTNEIDKEKDTKSEYEHYRYVEDFLDNRSLTNFSCKSGYTGTRKLRSLSRERDRIKLLNKCKNNEKDLGLIGDKLLKIVSNFHNNNNVVNFKNNKINENKAISNIKNF